MHPTRRELFRMGLGSSALLACGSTVPMFLGSLGFRPGWRWSGRVEGADSGRGPA